MYAVTVSRKLNQDTCKFVDDNASIIIAESIAVHKGLVGTSVYKACEAAVRSLYIGPEIRLLWLPNYMQVSLIIAFCFLLSLVFLFASAMAKSIFADEHLSASSLLMR